jgi:hypothetical protein
VGDQDPQANQQATAPAPAKKGPGLVERVGRAAWTSHQQRREATKAAKQQQGGQQDDLLQQSKKDGATVGAAFKNGLIVTAAIIVPVGCAVIAFLAAGFYFNGARDYSGDTNSTISYGLAFLVEFGLLALLTASAMAFWSGKPWHFIAALVFSLPLVYVSTSAQLLYLSTHVDVSAADQAAATLGAIPFVGYFIGGANGGAFILIARSCVTTVLELASCYVLARATINTKKIIAALREKAQANMELARYKRLENLDRRLDQFAMKALDSFEAALESGGSIKLVPLQAAEGEAAKNGNGTFQHANQ